jgi:predicted metal-binding protein
MGASVGRCAGSGERSCRQASEVRVGWYTRLTVERLVDSLAGAAPERLRARALELGAADALVTAPALVVTAEWVRVKCLYGGCHAGRCLTCPPHSPSPSQTRALLDEYESVLLLRFDVKEARDSEHLAASRRAAAVALQLERELFLAGHHKAFAIAGGRPCDLDDACGAPEACDCRASLRPGPAGCGIDVFTTCANAGWPLKVVQGTDEPYHRLALVLVD